MKKMLSMLVVLAMLLSIAVLSVGCSDTDNEPDLTIGERPTESIDPTATEGTGATGGAEGSGGGEGGGTDSSGGGEGTGAAVTKPVMAGNVVHKFYVTMEVSGSLGGMSTLEIYIELYDEANADGMVAIMGSNNGGSVSYTTYDNWTENEDGTITIRKDEFSTFDTKIVDGVAYFVGVSYSGSMPGSSAYVDVPEVDLSFETPDFGGDAEATEPVEGAEGTEPAATEGSEGTEGTEPAATEGSEGTEGTEPAATEGTVPAGTEGSEGSEGTETTPA